MATLVSKSKLDSFSRVEGLRVSCDDYLPSSKKIIIKVTHSDFQQLLEMHPVEFMWLVDSVIREMALKNAVTEIDKETTFKFEILCRIVELCKKRERGNLTEEEAEELKRLLHLEDGDLGYEFNKAAESVKNPGVQ